MITDKYTEPSYAEEQEYKNIRTYPRFKLLSESTLQIYKEDHTLMNLLQNVIVENREAHLKLNNRLNDENEDDFVVGYVIPHPSEELVEFTVINDNVFDVLEQGLCDIEEMCLIAVDKMIPQ